MPSMDAAPPQQHGPSSDNKLAIDFRRLRVEMKERRRQERAEAKEEEERKKAGASSEAPGTGNGNGNASGGGGGGAPGKGPPPPSPIKFEGIIPASNLPRSFSTEGLPPPRPLVPSEHSVRPDVLRTVQYVPSYLPEEWIDETLRYLRSLPEHSEGGFGGSGTGTGGGGGGSSGRRRSDERDHLGKWTTLRHARRRVALFDSTGSPGGGGGGENGRLPGPLGAVADALVESGAFPPSATGGGPPNHVLVNEYRPGEGIMAHTDGPAYEERTCTISVGGGDAILRFSPRRRADDDGGGEGKHEKNTVLEVLLRGDGSLVTFSGDAYIDYCHSIDEVEEERTSDKCGNAEGGITVKRGYRVSLTFRRKKRK